MTRPILLGFLVAAQIDASDLLRLAPPETESIVVVEVGRLRTSPRWPLLLHLAGQWRHFEHAPNETGFDPSSDLEELALLQVTGKTPGDLVILRGRFDASRLASFDRGDPDGHELRYRDVRVCARPPRERAPDEEGFEEYLQWTASVGGMVVIGPAETVRAALDSYLSEEPRSAWFTPWVARSEGRYEAWAVMRRPLPLGAEEEPAVEAPLRAGLGLDAKPRAEAEALLPTADQARRLEALLRGLLADAGSDPLLKMLAESTRISVEDRLVRLTVELDWEPFLVIIAGRRHF